jgi:hypothetical protein
VSIAPLLPAHTSVLFVLLDQHSTTAFRLLKAAQLGLAHARRPLFGAGCLATSLISPFSAQLSALDLSIVLGIRIASLPGVSSLGRRFGFGSLHFRSSGPVPFFSFVLQYHTRPSIHRGSNTATALNLSACSGSRTWDTLCGARAFLPAFEDPRRIRTALRFAANNNGDHTWDIHWSQDTIPLRHINRRRPPRGHLMDGHLGGRAHTSPPTCTCRRRETKKWWQGRLGRFETATQTVGQRHRRVEVLTG